MPELPEVEAARRAIEEHCINKKIVKAVIADDPKVIDGVSPSDFQSSLLGKTVISARRKGKNMWLQLDSPPFPSFQFGMAGAIYIKGVAVTKYKRSAVTDEDEWPSKYSKVFIQLDDGLELSFTDKRRFAKVRLLKDPGSVPPISELGPDALLEPMTVNELFSSLSKKKIGIKALLLDQSFISGIGNWIADEVLYQARIHPLQTASSLTKESCASLHNSIKEVIEKAVDVGADPSQFPDNWIYHSREKKSSKAFVDGKKIEFITAGGRTTAFVPELQKLSGNQATKTSITVKQTSRRNKGGNEDQDADEDEITDVKPKKKQIPKAKKLPAKGKSKKNGNEEEDDNDEEEKEEENFSDMEEDRKTKTKKVTKVERTAKRRNQINQSKKPTKKAKLSVPE